MAPVPLNVSALWRPWRQAGLPHLLLEPEIVTVINDALTARRNAVPVPASSPKSPPRRPVAATPPPSPPAAVPTVPPVCASAGAPHTTQPPERGEPTIADAPQTPTGATPGLAALPLTQWSEPWKERLRKTPPKPRIVWTYAELSQDLAGLGAASRGVFFRALFGELGMEPGSQALWPLNIPPFDGVDVLFFVSGIEALNPATVVFMGDAEPGELGFPRIAPFSSALWRGRRFVRLHSVDALRNDTKSRHNQLISQIKSFHRTF